MRSVASVAAGIAGSQRLLALPVIVLGLAGVAWAPAQSSGPLAYLGFDRNVYPGAAALPKLRRTFAFAGFWLNSPPGESSNSWSGKRQILLDNGFGFLILFNGRSEHELKAQADPASLGAADARVAAASAFKEGFPYGALIFIDQEEGGRMLPEQQAYLNAWADEVSAEGFRPGIYCSGIPAREEKGVTIVTANDIHEHAGKRQISFFVYADACPPSPGCAYGTAAPLPEASGVPFASVWQFAQSPRRRNFTRACRATYAADGNCYFPADSGAGQIFLDLDSATSSDPSNGRR